MVIVDASLYLAKLKDPKSPTFWEVVGGKFN